MSRGEIIARHYATHRPVRVRWSNGRIDEVQEIEAPSPPEDWFAPALVDLQVNGYAGVDFQQDDLSRDDLLVAARQLARDGCTQWLLTLVTDDWKRLTTRLRHLRALRAQSLELQHAIVGWHIEGPFLSAEPGFCGAHDPTVMIDPTEAHLRELRESTESDPLLLTLAPERSGALDAITLAKSLGFVVSLGHTNASADRLSEAVAAGASAFTHLGNGCPRTLDRHDNILWRVLENPALTVSLIPDAIHVSPAPFRLFHRLLPAGRVVYVSDAMSAGGAPPGRYRLGRLHLEVGPDQIVRLPGQPNFAGSALRPMDGIRRASGMLEESWQTVWPRYSTIPASLLGLPPLLEPGASADFCLVRVSSAGLIDAWRTYVRGVEFAR